MSTSHNRNPIGRNQHGDKGSESEVYCPSISLNFECFILCIVSLDDPRLVAALRGYHEELLTSNKTISARMAVEHEITLR